MKTTIEITTQAQKLIGNANLQSFWNSLASFLFSIDCKYCLVSKRGQSLKLFIPFKKMEIEK